MSFRVHSLFSTYTHTHTQKIVPKELSNLNFFGLHQKVLKWFYVFDTFFFCSSFQATENTCIQTQLSLTQFWSEPNINRRLWTQTIRDGTSCSHLKSPHRPSSMETIHICNHIANCNAFEFVWFWKSGKYRHKFNTNTGIDIIGTLERNTVQFIKSDPKISFSPQTWELMVWRLFF